MAKTKAKSGNEAPWDDINIGDQVKHPKFGVGTVLFRSGLGDHAKAIVVFAEEGQIKLMLKFAKLEKVGSVSKAEASSRSKAAAAASKAKKAKPVVQEEEEIEIQDDDAMPGEDAEFFDEDEEEGSFDSSKKEAGSND